LQGRRLDIWSWLKVRHSLELLRKENDSAEKILGVTQQRANEGFELPMEVTRSQLTKGASHSEDFAIRGREEELETYLRDQLGLAPEQQFDLAAETCPERRTRRRRSCRDGDAEQHGRRLAQSDVRAKEYRYRGEKGGYGRRLSS